MITIDEYTAQKQIRDTEREVELTDCFIRSAPSALRIAELTVRKVEVAQKLERLKPKKGGK